MLLTRAGLQIRVLLAHATMELLDHIGPFQKSWLAILNCHYEGDFLCKPAILLEEATASSQKSEMDTDGDYNLEQVRPYTRVWEGVLWLDPSFTLAGATRQKYPAQWQEFGCKDPAAVSLGKATDTTILLQEGSRPSLQEIPSPPLKIELAWTYSRCYLCLASHPPLRGPAQDYIPSFVSRLYLGAFSLTSDVVYGINEEHIGSPRALGAIYFACTTPGTPGFFIVWGFTRRKLPPRHFGHSGSAPPPDTSWWDEFEMECSVRG